MATRQETVRNVDRKMGVPSSDFAALFDKAPKNVGVLLVWAIDGLPVFAQVLPDDEAAADAARGLYTSQDFKDLTNTGHYQTLTGHLMNSQGIQATDVVLFKRAGDVQVEWVHPRKAKDAAAASKPKASKPKDEAAKSRKKSSVQKPGRKNTTQAKRTTTASTPAAKTANKRSPGGKPAPKTRRKQGR